MSRRRTPAPLPSQAQDREIAISARAEEIRQEEGPPPGRAQHVTEEDLEATQHRIRTGLPMAPMPGWRW